MKPEEIIELAKKAKLKANRYPAINEIERLLALHREALIASGELVPRESVETAVKAEREECARLAERTVIEREDGDSRDPDDSLFFEVCETISKAIRARSQP